jgi:hypothetical protein
MIKPGEVVTGVQVTKTDNCGDDTGQEGYDVCIMVGKEECVYYIEYSIDELEEQPNGIYSYDGEKYNQIENWEE